MTDTNREVCSILLQQARKDAKKAGIKLAKLSTWRDTAGSGIWYEVWMDADMIWQGNAFSATEAKVYAIWKLLERKGQ